MDTVSPNLQHKLGLAPPPRILVEKYLIEISKNYNVSYEPDIQVRTFIKLMIVVFCDQLFMYCFLLIHLFIYTLNFDFNMGVFSVVKNNLFCSICFKHFFGR